MISNLGFKSPVWGMVARSGLVVKGVIFVLILLSIFSWALIFYKYLQLKKVEKEDRDFLTSCNNGEDVQQLLYLSKVYRHGLIPQVFAEVYRWVQLPKEGDEEKDWDKVAQQRVLLERDRLSTHVGFLATIGNTAPFIGLFGTVWGIINAFQQIGLKGSASLAVVAPGIAEALVTTAMGLFVAIPAVMGYNYLVDKISRIEERAEGSSYLFIGLVKGKKHA